MPDTTKLQIDGKVYKLSGLNVNDSDAVNQTVSAIRNSPDHKQYLKDNSFVGLQTKRYQNEGYDPQTANLAAIDSRTMNGDVVAKRSNLRSNTARETQEVNDAGSNILGAGKLALHAPFDVLDRAIYNAGSRIRGGSSAPSYDEGGNGGTFADRLLSDKDVEDLANGNNGQGNITSGIAEYYKHLTHQPVAGSLFKGVSSPSALITLGLSPALKGLSLALEGFGASAEAASALSALGEAGSVAGEAGSAASEVAQGSNIASQVGRGLGQGANALDTIGKGFVPAQLAVTSPDLLTDPGKYLEENALGLAFGGLHAAGGLSNRLSQSRIGVPSVPEGVSPSVEPQAPQIEAQGQTTAPVVPTEPSIPGGTVHTLDPTDIQTVDAMNSLDPSIRIQPNPNFKAVLNEFKAKVQNIFTGKGSFINKITPQGFQEFIKTKTARTTANYVMNDAYDNLTSELSDETSKRLGIYNAADRQLAIKNQLLAKQFELDNKNLLLDPKRGEPFLDPKTGEPLLDPETGEPILTAKPLLNDSGLEKSRRTPESIQKNQQAIVNREQAYQTKLGNIALERDGSPLVDPVTGKTIKANGVSALGEPPTLEEFFNDPSVKGAIEKWNGKGLPELRKAYLDAGFDAESHNSNGHYSETYFPSEALDAEGYRQSGSPLATSSNGKYFGDAKGTEKFGGTGATYNDNLREILVNRHAGALGEAGKRGFIANLQNTDYAIHSDGFDKALAEGKLAYDFDPETKQKTLYIKTPEGYQKAVRIPLDDYVRTGRGDPIAYQPSGTVPYPEDIANAPDVLPNKAVRVGATKKVYDNFSHEPLADYRIPDNSDLTPERTRPVGPKGGVRPLNVSGEVAPNPSVSADTPLLTRFGNQRTVVQPSGLSEYKLTGEGSGKQFGFEEEPNRTINGALETNDQPDPFGRTRPSNIPVDVPLYDVNEQARTEYKYQAKTRIKEEAARLRATGVPAREALQQAVGKEALNVDRSILSTEHPPNLQPIPEGDPPLSSPSLYTTGAIGNEFKGITEQQNATALGNIFEKVSGSVIQRYLTGLGEFINHGSSLTGRVTSALNNDISHAGILPIQKNLGLNVAGQALRGVKRGSLISTIQTLSDLRTSIENLTPEQKTQAYTIAAEMGYLPSEAAGVETRTVGTGLAGKLYAKTSKALYGDNGLVTRGLASIYHAVNELYPTGEPVSEEAPLGSQGTTLSPDAENAYRSAIQRFNRDVAPFKPTIQQALGKVGLGTFYGTGTANIRSAYNAPVVQAVTALATHAVITTLMQKALDNRHRWANEVGAKIGEFYFDGSDGRTYKYAFPNFDSELNKPTSIVNAALQGVYKQADIDHTLKDVGVAGLNQLSSPLTGGPITGALSGYAGIAPAFRANDSLDGIQPISLPQSKTGLFSFDRLAGAVKGVLPLSGVVSGSTEDRQADENGEPNLYSGLNHLLPLVGQRDVRPLIDLETLRSNSSKQEERRNKKNDKNAE